MVYPTPYPEVNAVLDDLLARVQEILRHEFVGMYLCGSLALRDFMPGRSDIDIVVATADVLSDEAFAALKAMHTQFVASGSPLARELEGSYVPLNDLRWYDSTNALYPRIDRGQTLRVEHSSWWVIDRYVLREHGIILAGPPPKTLVPRILRSELQQAARNILHNHWEWRLNDPVKLRPPDSQVYAVLTMCRILYTFQYGTVVSKTEAAAWVQRTLPEQMITLVTQALEWRNGKSFDYLNETMDLIRYTVQHTQ
jgi:hypothetical protein